MSRYSTLQRNFKTSAVLSPASSDVDQSARSMKWHKSWNIEAKQKSDKWKISADVGEDVNAAFMQLISSLVSENKILKEQLLGAHQNCSRPTSRNFSQHENAVTVDSANSSHGCNYAGFDQNIKSDSNHFESARKYPACISKGTNLIKCCKDNSTKRRTSETFPMQILRDCKFCGLPHLWGSAHCPAYGKTCKKCLKKNHSHIVCKNKIRKPQKSKSLQGWSLGKSENTFPAVTANVQIHSEISSHNKKDDLKDNRNKLEEVHGTEEIAASGENDNKLTKSKKRKLRRQKHKHSDQMNQDTSPEEDYSDVGDTLLEDEDLLDLMDVSKPQFYGNPENDSATSTLKTEIGDKYETIEKLCRRLKEEDDSDVEKFYRSRDDNLEGIERAFGKKTLERYITCLQSKNDPWAKEILQKHLTSTMGEMSC